MKALITGIGGFCGSYLAELLLAKGAQVVGLEPPGSSSANLKSLQEQIELRWVDIRDVEHLRETLRAVQPERVYHLAAVTQLPPSGDHSAMYAINVQGTLNLLDEMLALGIKCPVLLVGSGAQYGPPQPDEVPICETNVCRPVTHYAVTKAMQDLLGYSYWRQGLPIVRTRAFNVIGPRQSADFVGSAIAKQIAEIECGLRPAVIELGNLDTERDFVDVRDVAQAYYLALEQGRPGEAYNIGSGKAVSIHAVLEALLGLSTVKQIEVRQSQARVRKGDVPTQIADYTKLRQQTGWRPTITLEQSLADLLQYWREISC